MQSMMHPYTCKIWRSHVCHVYQVGISQLVVIVASRKLWSFYLYGLRATEAWNQLVVDILDLIVLHLINSGEALGLVPFLLTVQVVNEVIHIS